MLLNLCVIFYMSINTGSSQKHEAKNGLFCAVGKCSLGPFILNTDPDNSSQILVLAHKFIVSSPFTSCWALWGISPSDALLGWMMSFFKWIDEFTDGLSVFSGPSLNVVAKQIRAASVGGATFEMSCTVSTENLGEVGYSVLIQSQDSLEGTVKTIMTLSPDNVLQHGGATDPGRRYTPAYMVHINAQDYVQLGPLWSSFKPQTHQNLIQFHIFYTLWDVLNFSVIIIRIDCHFSSIYSSSVVSWCKQSQLCGLAPHL